MLTATLAVLPSFFAASGQETGYRNFGNAADSRTIPVGPAGELPEIEVWLPYDEFAEEVREALTPAVSMSSVMKVQRDNAPKRIFILPNNALSIWRITVSNGSAGNWGTPPANFLDARTLSFPTP